MKKRNGITQAESRQKEDENRGNRQKKDRYTREAKQAVRRITLDRASYSVRIFMTPYV